MRTTKFVAVRLFPAEARVLEKAIEDGLIPDSSSAIRLALRYLPTILAMDLLDNGIARVKRELFRLERFLEAWEGENKITPH